MHIAAHSHNCMCECLCVWPLTRRHWQGYDLNRYLSKYWCSTRATQFGRWRVCRTEPHQRSASCRVRIHMHMHMYGTNTHTVTAQLLTHTHTLCCCAVYKYEQMHIHTLVKWMETHLPTSLLCSHVAKLSFSAPLTC